MLLMSDLPGLSRMFLVGDSVKMSEHRQHIKLGAGCGDLPEDPGGPKKKTFWQTPLVSFINQTKTFTSWHQWKGGVMYQQNDFFFS